MQEGKSVGAIIKDREGRYLVQYRLKTPVGLALPAGHIEDDESAREALVREVLEETGVKIAEAEEVLNIAFPNPCAQGHDFHRWWVFEVKEWSGKLRHREYEQHRFVRFMKPQEIKLYVLRGEYDPAWFDYIFPALGIVI